MSIMKTILELSHTEARSYFLKQENYCSIKLPPYFDFQSLLNELSKKIGCKPLGDLNKNLSLAKKDKKIEYYPENNENVNYTIYTNKDGQLAWRPLQLINPVIYVCLVHSITEENNWKAITDRFKKFCKNENIICSSIPIVKVENNNDETKTKDTILNWWQEIEQESIESALDFSCMLNTDIVDCYGSIYTHSIPWALHSKKVAKEKRTDKKLIGNNVDSLIQSMSYSQTNGIPQGSVLMDFIAEMVLGYADILLSEKIAEYDKIGEYKILRYRDDYRIFTKTQEDAVKIVKLLSEVLQGLNFKINSQKTFISNNIIKDSVKPDKLYWNESKQGEKTLQKHLLLIYSLAEKHPNSGSLSKALDKFHNRIHPLSIFKDENVKILCSILIEIACKNPRTYPIICACLGKILSVEVNQEFKEKIYSSIKVKGTQIPNVGHLEIWLQRLTVKENKGEKYDEKLCKKVYKPKTEIWNNVWLRKEFKDIFNKHSIINHEKIEKMPSTIEPKEVKVFDY